MIGSLQFIFKSWSARDTFGPEEITPDIPNVSEASLALLDESGIVYIGAEVNPVISQ